MRFDNAQQIVGSGDIDPVKGSLGIAPDSTRAVDHGMGAGDQLRQRWQRMQVACHQLYAHCRQVSGGSGVSDQGSDVKTLLQQMFTKGGADEAGSAREGDQSASWDQADATIRRTSSAAAFSCSMLWALMKSNRALARDNLPEDVRGKARLGTSLT